MAALTAFALLSCGIDLQFSQALAQTEKFGHRLTIDRSKGDRASSELWRFSKLVGKSVLNEAQEKVGVIVDIIIRPEGPVRAVGVVIDVSGFVDMKSHDVVLDFDRLTFSELSPRSATALAKDRREGKTPTESEKRIERIATLGDWAPDHAIAAGATISYLKSLPALARE